LEGKTKHELEEMFMTKKKNGGMIYGAGMFDEGGESQELPERTRPRRFVKTPNTKKIALEDLIPIRAREKGIANAEKYMRMAFYDGNMDRSKPISVSKFGDKHMVEDGNLYVCRCEEKWLEIYLCGRS
jgi:hypothetical protein